MKIEIASACLFITTILLGACSGTSDRPTPASSGAAASTGVASPALDGTWAFALDASDVAANVRASCQTKSAGDAPRADACYAEIRAEAANEKIRFTKDSAGHMVWTSFGQDDAGREELWLEVPLDLSSESPTRLLGKVAGPAKGAHAERAAKHLPAGALMRFEIVDDHTVAMVGTEKGRLVYTREPR